jgi:hypothetical protein
MMIVFYDSNMKIHEITDPDYKRKLESVLEAFDKELYLIHNRSLSRVLNYIFVLNSGSLIGSLTYISSNNADKSIVIPILSFALGTIAILLHSTIDYYKSLNLHKDVMKSLAGFYQGQCDHSEVFSHSTKDRLLHALGWIAGSLFVFGLITGIYIIIPK